jgi:hypothetical protein
MRGAGNNSFLGMWESVSASPGPMWTNWDEVQQATQPWHDTFESFLPRIAPFISTTHDKKSPASKTFSLFFF